MKKMIFAALLASTAALGVAGVNAHAVEEPTDGYPGNIVTRPAETPVGISYEEDGTISVDKGPFAEHLAIVFKPTKFNFGGNKTATLNNAEYEQEIEKPATPADAWKYKQHLIVNDDRKAVDADPDKGKEAVVPGKEWQLIATYSGLTAPGATPAEDVKLTSFIDLELGAVQNYNIGDKKDPVTQDYIPANPTEIEKGVLTDLDKAEQDKFAINGQVGSTATAAVKLEAGKEVKVLGRQTADNANTTHGVATEINKVKLTVTNSKLSKVGGKSFTGSVTWKLKDTYQ